jgi:hypothetical protein
MSVAREEIADVDWLYRRLGVHSMRRADGSVHPNAFMRSAEPSGRLKEPDPEISIDLARLTTSEQSLAVAHKPDQGIGAIQAGFPRALGLDAVHAPIEEPPERRNPAHSLIVGNVGDGAMDRCHAMAEEMTKHVR